MDSLFTAFVMGFWGVVYALIGGLLFLKAVQGDITFREAALIFSPLAVCFILMGVTNGTPFFYVFLVASLVWIVWLTMRQTIAEQKVESDIVAEEVEKWSQAVAQDARNVGAHVFLGHAHARGARYDTAAEEYRRALELDATSARDINRYLAMRSNAEAAAVRSRLPELDRVTRELKQRSCYTPRPGAAAPPAGAENGSLAGGTADDGDAPAPEQPPSGREFFGYASEEEHQAELERHGRLTELRSALDNAPDDVPARLAYARLLEEVGQAERAAGEYAHALTLKPGDTEAKRALARLGVAAVDAELPETMAATPSTTTHERVAG